MFDDVNQAAEPAASESSTEAPQNQGEGQVSPAEALNAENQLGPVPYERFKEVNEKYQGLNGRVPQLEAAVNEYEQLKPFIEKAQRFDQLLINNPQLVQLIQQHLAQSNGQQQVDPVLAEALNASQQALAISQQGVYNQYMGDFNQFVEKEQLPQEAVPVVQELTRLALLQINPNPLGGYDKASITHAITNVKKFLDGVFNHRQAQYTKQKQSTETTPNNSGLPAFKKPDYSDPEVRRAKFREMAQKHRG